MKLSGKVALVTGGARNIGRAITLRLVEEGASVLMHYGPGTEEDAHETMRLAKGNVVMEGADISEPGTVETLLRSAKNHFGRIDILINNAATTGRRGKLSEMETQDFDQAFALNARSVFLAMKAAFSHLSEGGRIISISSSTTVHPQPDLGIYTASKAAVKALTEVFAMEAGERSITVNTVMPGATVPGMFQGAPEARRKEIALLSPFKRLGQPADIADVVAFLASEDARWITGQHLLVNGGGLS
jgi:3-oxoacyl-[acyl-carrier protein] reductase